MVEPGRMKMKLFDTEGMKTDIFLYRMRNTLEESIATDCNYNENIINNTKHRIETWVDQSHSL